MTLPNGSVIYLLGADTDEEEKQKLLGQKYAAVVIDESASFSVDLTELVYGILKPAVADYRGCISLIGTPGNLKRGLFFELTQGQDPLTAGRWEARGWSCHRWSASHNPHMAKQWAGEIEELKKANPLIEETSLFQQHYLGRWTVDESKLVYRYQAGRNDAASLPEFPRGDWHYVLGVDLGYSPDPSAFVVCAYHDFGRALYVLEATKETELDVTAVAERIRSIQARYDISTTVIDNANKQAVEEMRARHNIQLTAADKTGKMDFIELLNGDLIQGYVKLLPAAEPLRLEMMELVLDERSEKRQEHPACANHCADGFLYNWRFCYPYLAQAIRPSAPAPQSKEWHEANAKRALEEEQKMYENAVEEVEERNRQRDEESEMMGFL